MGVLLQILALVALVGFGGTFGLRGALLAACVALLALGVAFADVSFTQLRERLRRPWIS